MERSSKNFFFVRFTITGYKKYIKNFVVVNFKDSTKNEDSFTP